MQPDLSFGKDLKYANTNMTAATHEFSKTFPLGKISNTLILI
jgi:hypothetical protein